jgi:hypothetical protein
MAEEHVEETPTESDEQQSDEQGSNGNGRSNGHNIGRVAAVAAATGATAYAARKALQSRSPGQSDEERPRKKQASSGGGTAALVTSAVASGWDVAKDSLLPIVEDAAGKAGAYVAESSPDLVRDVVVPRFIAGFEKARGGKRNAASGTSDD